MLLLSFLAGLAGSLHCIGMCGPIVLAYAAQPRIDVAALRWTSLAPSHLLYNGGRLLGYTSLGFLAGLIGGMLGSVRLAAPYVAIVAGLLVVVAGVVLLDVLPRSFNSSAKPGWFRRSQFRWVGSLLSLRTNESVLYLGIVTAFLPCGLLYGMFLQAAASGSAFQGALYMFAFGAGTVPALMLAGFISSFVGTKARLFAHRVAAVILIAMGVLLMVRGAGMTMVEHRQATQAHPPGHLMHQN